MISEDVLEAGIAKGILSGQQAGELRALAREITATSIPEPEDDEKLRFITGFNDIFVTLGLVLFTTALGYFASWINPVTMWAVLAAAAWALAEFFTRSRRMALPSIALLLLFTVSVFAAAGHGLNLAFIGLEPSGGYSSWGFNELHPGLSAIAALITTGLTALHYKRFGVPITLAAGAAALSGAAIALLYAFALEFTVAYLSHIVLILGLVVFAFAMRFDLSDPARVTRRTDIAFWLHLLAAPLIVHALVWQIVDTNKSLQIWMALSVLAIFLALSAVAVAIDRRAMLVSGLGYAGYAFASLIERVGLNDQVMPATLLVLGAFVLLLSAGWRPVRTALLKRLPPQIARNLPHPLTSS